MLAPRLPREVEPGWRALRELRGRARPIAAGEGPGPRYPSANRHPDPAVSWTSPSAQDVVERHPGRRRRHPALPAHQGPGQAGRAPGGKYRLVDIPISNCLNSDCAGSSSSPSSTRLAPPAHPGELQVRPLLARLRRDPGRAAADRPDATGIRARPTRCGRTSCTSTDYPLRPGPDPLGRPALPDGLPRDHRQPRGDRGGGHHRHDCRCGPRPRGLRHHADRDRRADHRVRREAQGPGGAGSLRVDWPRWSAPRPMEPDAYLASHGHLRLRPRRPGRRARRATRPTSASTSSPS